jgi:hypothetical protein
MGSGLRYRWASASQLPVPAGLDESQIWNGKQWIGSRLLAAISPRAASAQPFTYE